MAKVAVEVSGMDFSYKKEALFEKFNLTIREGQLIGVVGVNGSGKSTFLKLLAGLLKPQGGRITIHGEKAGSFPSKFLVGASLQEIDFPGTEKAQEVLEFVASQYSEALPISPLIQDYNLKGFTGKACSQLSGGMKRRLSLACALVGRPPVVLLDEPTTGLDTQSRQELMENLKAYKEREEALILMISHYPEEIFEQVDEFYHMRPNAIERLTAERMDQLSRIKKISFRCPEGASLPLSLRMERCEDEVHVFTDNGDRFIQELCRSQVPFSELSSRKIMTHEILEDLL